LGYPDPPKSARLAWESLGTVQLRAQHWQTAPAVEAYRNFLWHWNNADEELPQMRHAWAWLAARSQ
jgi:hypothetical protein